MNRTGWVAALLVIAGLLCGCGAEQSGPAKVGNDVAEGGSEAVGRAASATTEKTATFQSSTPKEAVAAFLEALRSGDKVTTEALLSQKARQETAAHDLMVEPPGAPGATYSIEGVEPVEGDQNSAYVSCIWSEKENDAEFEVVWILRNEQAGWRIAGMATRLGDTEEPVVLNFEDLSELEQAMRDAEVAERQQNTTPAEVPEQDQTTLR